MSKRLLLRGARQLLTLRGPSGPRRGLAMGELGIIENGALLIEDGRITQVGPSRRIENLEEARRAEELDVAGRVVMPGFVDSHTHLVYGPPRLIDYELRLAGKSYEEIAKSGGGILSSMTAVRNWASPRLERQAAAAVSDAARHGTTTIEAKSGYGLDLSSEVKALKVAANVGAVPTFLGAHVVPPEFAGRGDDYVGWLIAEVMPQVARRKLAKFADVYCDRIAFSLQQTRRYLEGARAQGFLLKLHANQFTPLGAVGLGVEMGAVSVDHLEVMGPGEVDLLARSRTIATLLPGSVFHLGLDRYAPARELIESGAAVALATDFNPGTSPTCSMPMVMSLACARMRMTPAEAVTAATINGAHALRLGAEAGSLEPGKWADMVVVDLDDYRELPYYFGVNHVELTMKKGEVNASKAG